VCDINTEPCVLYLTQDRLLQTDTGISDKLQRVDGTKVSKVEVKIYHDQQIGSI